MILPSSPCLHRANSTPRHRSRATPSTNRRLRGGNQAPLVRSCARLSARSFAGAASGQFGAGNSVTLLLSTDGTHVLPVTGTTGGNQIVGSAMFADGVTSFTAILTSLN